MRDEAAHGTFGFTFLDWALGKTGDDGVALVGRAADRGIRFLKDSWATLRKQRAAGEDVSGDTLGWMRSDAYLALAEKSLEDKVRAPLRERGVPLSE